MLTIELSNLRFHAYHGFYKEEKVLGGDFEVNVSVLHQPKKIPVLHINETIDYAAIYDVIKEVMQKSEPLLETVATIIAAEILRKFSLAEEVNVTVTKVNPPVIGYEGNVKVKCLLRR